MNFQAIKKAFWIFRIFSFFWTVENRAQRNLVLFSGPCRQHLPKDRQIRPLMEHTTTRHRGRSPSSKDNDGRESKKYVSGLTPPRHTTGGLLYSWLVDQQTSFDGQRWPLLCPPCPRRWASHHAIPPTVLGPGMGQVYRLQEEHC